MKKIVRIYQTPLVLEHEDNATYILLTETENFKPVRCYVYRVPENIANLQISDFEKRYFVLCDN